MFTANKENKKICVKCGKVLEDHYRHACSFTEYEENEEI